MIDKSSPDPKIMEAIRDDDVQALEVLLERYWERLVHYVMRMSEGFDEAEDIAQEVFVRVWEHRSRWSSDGSAQAYLYTIARNLVLLRSRRKEVRARKAEEIRTRIDRVATPDEEASFEQCRAVFKEALMALPERRREAFTLVRLQGLSIREAAEVMGVTGRTVTNQVYLATRCLEEALRDFLI